MDEDRMAISDELWERIAPLLPGKASDPGATGRDNRGFMEAVLWRVRTGSPWRDLPKDFGNWNSVFKRFCRWADAGVFESLFNAINGEPDLPLCQGSCPLLHSIRISSERMSINLTLEDQLIVAFHALSLMTYG